MKTHKSLTLAVTLATASLVGLVPGQADALEIANDVEYGLAAYLWTNDLNRAMRMTDELEAGMMWVNSENIRHLPTPFGGVKSSGIGRDGGDWSFEFYMEQKHVGFATGQHKIMRLGA